MLQNTKCLPCLGHAPQYVTEMSGKNNTIHVTTGTETGNSLCLNTRNGKDGCGKKQQLNVISNIMSECVSQERERKATINTSASGILLLWSRPR